MFLYAAQKQIAHNLIGLYRSLGDIHFCRPFWLLAMGLKTHSSSFFVDDSTNSIWLYPSQTEKPYRGYKAKRRIIFKNDDLADIKQNFSFFIDYITPRISRGALVKYAKESNNYTIRAVAPGHQFAEKNHGY